MEQFTGIFSLVGAFGLVLIAWNLAQDRRREALWIVASTVILLSVPSFVSSVMSQSVASVPGDYISLVGTWYGGGRTAEIINTCAGVGGDFGEKIWNAMLSAYLPQMALLYAAGRIYVSSAISGGWGMVGFCLIGSICIPMVVGGPSAAFPQAVLRQSSELIGSLITGNQTSTKEAEGYRLYDIQLARDNARIPSSVRDMLVVYQIAARAAVGNDTLAPLLTQESAQQLANKAITIDQLPRAALTQAFPGRAGPLDALPIGLGKYCAADPWSSVQPFLWTPTMERLYVMLSDEHGRLRDKSDIGKSFCVFPFSGRGDAAKQVLKQNITALYEIYNSRSTQQSIDQVNQSLQAQLVAPGATISISPEDLAGIQARLKTAVDANAPHVEPPDVVDTPEIMQNIDLRIRQLIVEQAKAESSDFTQDSRTNYLDPSFLFAPNFYGISIFAGDKIKFPLDSTDENYAQAQALVEKNNWGNWSTSPGIQHDLATGIYSGSKTGDNLDDTGFLSLFFLKAPSWLGFKMISNLLTMVVPMVSTVVPWVSGLAFVFLLAAYPIFAVAALLPGRWTVLLDWSKGVLWVMSWAVCYQLGQTWIHSQPVSASAGSVSWAERNIGGNVWVLMGVIVIVAAPAFTSFVLGASVSAIQNIGGNLMQMGMRLLGAAQMLGSVTMVGITAGVGATAGAMMAGASAAAGGAATAAGGAGAAAAGAGATAATGAASGATAGAGLLSSLSQGASSAMSALPGIAKSATSWAGKAAELGSAGASRLDSLLPNPATGAPGGSGYGAGAHAIGPLRMDERSASGGSSGGRGSASTSGATAPGGVSVAGGSSNSANATKGGAFMAGQARATDASMAAGPVSPDTAAKAERQHAAAARGAGSPAAIAHHESMAADMAVRSGSSMAERRLSAAAGSVAAAVGGAKTDGEQVLAHQAGARTQMARANHLEAQGDSGGAQVCRSAAAGHLVAAGSAAARQLGSAGSDDARVAAVSTVAGIAASAGTLMNAGVSPQAHAQLGTLIGGSTATLQAHAAGNHGASSHAAAGYIATGTPAAAQHFAQAAAATSTPSVAAAMTAAAAASSGSDSQLSQVSRVVRRVAVTMEGGDSVATSPYQGLEIAGNSAPKGLKT